MVESLGKTCLCVLQVEKSRGAESEIHDKNLLTKVKLGN
jgi:hypothetical protein